MSENIDTELLEESLSDYISDDEANIDELINNAYFNDNGTLIIIEINGFVLEFDSETYNFVGGLGGVSPENVDNMEC